MWDGSSVISSLISFISVITPQVPHLIWHWFIFVCLQGYKQLFPVFSSLFLPLLILLLFTFVSSIIIQSDVTQSCLLIISSNMALLCSTTCASFISPLRRPSVPPPICPFIHPYIFLWDLLWLVRRLMRSASQENGTHYFWWSTSSRNYSSSSASPIFTYHLSFHLQALPPMFVFLFHDLVQKPPFKHTSRVSARPDTLRLISVNQLHMAQAQWMTQETHGTTTITQLEMVL